MNESDSPTRRRSSIERALDVDVRPGLSAHAGSIEVRDLGEDSVDLEFIGSCRSCYFRISCAVNLVAPTVRDAIAAPITVRIRGVSQARLARLAS